jgi:hypothetical protein
LPFPKSQGRLSKTLRTGRCVRPSYRSPRPGRLVRGCADQVRRRRFALICTGGPLGCVALPSRRVWIDVGSLCRFCPCTPSSPDGSVAAIKNRVALGAGQGSGSHTSRRDDVVGSFRDFRSSCASKASPFGRRVRGRSLPTGLASARCTARSTVDTRFLPSYRLSSTRKCRPTELIDLEAAPALPVGWVWTKKMWQGDLSATCACD